MRNITVISKNNRSLVTITHRVEHPGTWIVKRWKIFLGFRTWISTEWFNDPAQAAAFAAGVIRGT